MGTGVTDGRAARWHSHRETRRLALIRAARRAVHLLGPGASMEDIAAAAGTSKSVFYRYFGDKAGLRRAVGEMALASMQETVLAAARSATTARQGMHAMVSAYLQMASSSPNVYAFVTRPPAGHGTSNSEGPEPLSEFFAAVTDLLAETMRAFLRDMLSGRQLATALAYWPQAAIGMVRAAGDQWLSTPDGAAKPSEQRMSDQLTKWLLDGITTTQAATRTSMKDTDDHSA